MIDRTFPPMLPGVERYVRQAVSPWQQDPNDAVMRANLIDVRSVLADHHGIEVPEGNWKFQCPWGFEHADGGLDKACKIYATANMVYCFALHSGLTPVRLTMMRLDLKPKAAAYRLLEDYGLLRPRGYRARYEAVLQEVERRRDGRTDVQVLVEALHSSLVRRVPAFGVRQFDPDVREAMALELDRLSELPERAGREQLRAWLEAAVGGVTDVV